MSLASFYLSHRKALSFELFPPKTPAGDAALLANLRELSRFRPDFVTCTYGAGGSTRGKTLDVCRMVKREFGLPVASHLTVVGSTVDELRAYLDEAIEAGIDHLVALRGDPPAGSGKFEPVPGGLSYADQLVSLVREQGLPLGIAVAGYPEVHQEAPDAATDLRNLKRKVDAGADIVLTQLFYDNDDYFRFVDACEREGITVPIVPGILPIVDLAQVQRITSLCRAKLPQRLLDRLGEHATPEWQQQVGIEHATEQVRDLLERDAPGIHFYVLNKSQATSKVLEAVDWHGS
ncbi:MAG TPA: methylenetetrahydrofolate reductase [NAD(P)H] [Planctomycetaceae bacterium]|mgnify:FL=1|nr:methylenetetrahydrofolate reductase [NAD(P)H] [Planctomycetaceae bacterium]HRE99747.1 methylenetetrahydrofolate reductase [NAD(P)H] [Pirellulaceae bacterium]